MAEVNQRIILLRSKHSGKYSIFFRILYFYLFAGQVKLFCQPFLSRSEIELTKIEKENTKSKIAKIYETWKKDKKK
jgi:hypothetical protein